MTAKLVAGDWKWPTGNRMPYRLCTRDDDRVLKCGQMVTGLDTWPTMENGQLTVVKFDGGRVLERGQMTTCLLDRWACGHTMPLLYPVESVKGDPD